jgi:hypothetical protein
MIHGPREEKIMKKGIYKEWYDCSSNEEQVEKWQDFISAGYADTDIIMHNYFGTDGKFHREIYVYA